jgi:hypothetical protein
MASRYNQNSVKKLNDGREVYQTKVLPKIPKSDNDIYVAVQTGDRLDSIAKEYLGDASLWWIIADANNIHDAPFSLADGTVLRIPSNPQSVINAVNKV